MCLTKDWNIVKSYRLEAILRKIVFMAKMLNDTKLGEIDALVLALLLPIAKAVKHLSSTLEILQKHSASLVSLKKSIAL